jgi:cytochrome c553
MQVRLANFPLAADDPHAGMCASCHNPHDQRESQ